jgi:hypothetical protein
MPVPSHATLHATVLALCLASTAHAVRINPQGEGQALIFPYYTTAAGNASALTLSNYSATGKLVQVRVADGENGRTVLAFNVYLGRYDIWTATLFDRGGDAGPALVTDDDSCTYPQIRDSQTLPQLPGGRRIAPFALPSPDAGSAGVARLREGFIEAVELASVRVLSRTDRAINGLPRRCETIIEDWAAPDGRWLTTPLADFANPTGRLGGDLAIINVGNGTVFGIAPVALDEYRVDPQDRPRGSRDSVARHARADGIVSLLNDALSDPASGRAAASIVADGTPMTLTYPSPGRATDAVSAVFMAAELWATIEEEPEIGARSSYALTYPTRAFYTDPALSGPAGPLPPFGLPFAGIRPLLASPGYRTWVGTRTGQVAGEYGCEGFGGCPGPVVARVPGTSVELVAPGGSPDPLLGTRLHGDLGPSRASQIARVTYSGWIRFDLASAENRLTGEPLRPSLEGRRLLGVPVIANRFTNYVNTAASPGVLANYSLARPMTARARCVEENGTPCAP